MKFFARSSFVVVFLFVFSISLLILGSFQAFFGTIRWYNSSEQKHENLQKYPIYSATDESPKGDTIRVTIGKKPVISRDVFVVVPNAPQSSEIVSTVNPEKTLETTLKREDYQTSNFTEIVHIKPFKSPIQILLEPSESAMPPGYLATIDSVLAGTYFREILWQFPLTVDTNRLSPRGQMSNESVILSGRIKSTPEMAKVLVHELGHMVDIYLLKQRVKS